jgi:hypothetical protein
MTMRHAQIIIWSARGLIGLVFFFNIQCAVVFLTWPQAFAPAFELSGEVGEAMLSGLGILFLMWNVPYALACVHPVRRIVSLYEAAVMQFIGVLGESLVLLSLSAGHGVLRESLGRFIVFDAAGLGLLLLAIWLVRKIT